MKHLLLASTAILIAGSAVAQQQNIPPNAPFKATGSTTARTQAARAADVINGKDFGVKCDGATDDYAALQAAATAAGSSTTKTVFLPPSSASCLLSQAVSIPSGVTVHAYPNSVTLAPTAGNVSSVLLLSFATGAQNVLVYGLSFDGGGASFANTGNVIQAFNGSNIVLDHVLVKNTRGIAAVFSTSIVNSGIRDSSFINIGNGWTVTQLIADRQQAVSFCCGTASNNVGNFVTGSYFENIGLDAISTTAQASFNASGNRFNMENGQLVATWSGTQPTAFSAAIYGSGGNLQFTAQGNNISGASGNAIDVAAGDAVITNNYIINSGQAGIGFFTSGTASNGSISGNTILNSGIWASSVFRGGISVSGALGKVSITGNVATDNQGSKTQQYGVQIISGSTFSDLRIDPTNSLEGNAVSQFGGIISEYTHGGTIENRVLNPCFSVDQRSAGGTYAAGGGNRLIMDQWVATQSTNGFTEARSTATAFPGCGKSSMHVVLTNSKTAAVADVYGVSQSIETNGAQDLQWGTSAAQPVMVEFCAQSSVSGTYGAALRNTTGPRAYILPYTLAAGTPACFNFIVPGDTVQPIATTGYGLILGFDFGSGTNLATATTGAWVTGTFLSATTSTLFLGQTNGATFDVSSVRLYKGTAHIPWIQRSPASEMSLLQRYFWTTFQDGTAPAQSAGATGAVTMIDPGTGATGVWLGFPQRMRAAPTITLYSTGAASANCYDATAVADGGAASAVNTGVDGVFIKCASASVALDQLQVHIAATAE